MAQNPDFYAPGNSPIPQLLYNTSHATKLAYEQFIANGRESAEQDIMTSIVQTYYNNTTKPFVLDKCREWTEYTHLITNYIDATPKIVVLVRPIDEIIISFKDIYKKNKRLFDPLQFLTPSSPPLMIAIKGLMTAISSGKDCYLYVSYKSLVENPDYIFSKVYDFFELPQYQHDFDGIVQETQEKDFVYDLEDLHKVRPKVEYRKTSTKLDPITQTSCDRLTDKIFNNPKITIL